MKLSVTKRDLRVVFPAVTVGLGLLFLPGVARSQFGFPQIVFDPTAVAKIAAEIQQVTAIYNQAVQSYNLARAMSQQFTNKPWRIFGINPINIQTPNRWGETVNWDVALNTGTGYGTAWQAASFALRDMSFAQGTDQARTLGHVEMADSAGQSTLATLGTCSSIATQNSSGMADLESNIMDGSADTNSQVQQANLTNAALAQQMRLLQCSEAIQYEQTKQTLITNLRNRDSEAGLLNTYADAQAATLARPSNLSSMNSLFDAELQ